MTTYTTKVIINFNPDGEISSAHEEKVMSIDDMIIPIPATMLSANTLSSVLPSSSALLSELVVLRQTVASANTVKAGLESTIAALEAQVETLNNQLHPTDESGTAILTAVQIRLGLLAAGITTAMIEAVISAIPDALQKETAKTYWDYSTTYRRTHPLVAQFGTALNLTEEQINTMWAAASQIQ